MGGIPWASEEIDFLREHSPRMMHQEMAKLLGKRTATAVRRQCMKLGILRGYWHLPPHQELPIVPILQAAYFAGHFDGEGCVYMLQSKSTYKMACAVTGAWRPTLEVYKNTFGGAVTPVKKRINKPLFRWLLTGYAATLFFLQTLLPYLSEKAEQAHLAIAFIQLRITASHAYPGQDIKQKARECFHALRLAKRAA